MTKSSDNHNPNLAETTAGQSLKARYKNHFVDTVDKAQYLLMYASSKCPKDIKPKTIEAIITARRRVENEGELDPKEEANFWLAYQDIWKLVEPVTAESVKANLPIESATNSLLLRLFPFLSRWFGKQIVVKSRRTVNRYIVFAAFVLLLLLLNQIYWVIGNQLTTQLADLLQKQTELSAQVSENQKEFSVIQILYEQNEIESGKYDQSVGFTYDSTPEWRRDTLENLSEKARLENEQESLKLQQDRSSAILGIWTQPWESLITTEIQSTNDKYEPQIQSINAEMLIIQGQIAKDSDGAITASALNDALSPELNVIDEQLRNLYTGNDEITLQAESIQGKIETVNNQLTDLAGDEITRTNRNADLELQAGELDVQLADLEAKESVNREQAKGISDQLISLAGDPGADQSLKSALESQLTELDAQFLLLQVDKETVQEQKDEISAQLTALVGDETARQSRKEELNLQLTELNSQLTDLETSRAIIGDQIQSLQSQANDLLSRLVPPEQIVIERNQQLEQLNEEINALERQKLADANRERSRQAQLAGKFVLDILQGYLLPLLYGVLGAATFVLRTISRQIETVTYSDEAGVQHLSRISLGALAGIMVGWFSFLINTSTFFGTVSPLAIAFLVGYNIELFFSLMDVAINRFKNPQKEQSSTNKASGVSKDAPPKVESNTGNSAE